MCQARGLSIQAIDFKFAMKVTLDTRKMKFIIKRCLIEACIKKPKKTKLKRLGYVIPVF